MSPTPRGKPSALNAGHIKRNFDRHFIDTDVLTLARERIAQVYDQFDHVAVMFSGGKDSTVCLMLTLDEARRRGALPLHVVFFDEECIPLQTVEYVERVRHWPEVALDWYCIPIKHRNACSRQSPWWYPWAPEVEELWVRQLPEGTLTTMPGLPIFPVEARLTNPQLNGLMFDPQVHGRTAMVMGIRAQESITRLRAVTGRALDNWLIQYADVTSRGNLWKAYPIYDWRTEDVWTAPQRFGWDYNRAYDALEAAGLPQSLQRCSPAFGEEPLQKLWTYSQCFPEMWDRMCHRVPGAATAARYALTELYGYHARPEKPPEMSWEDFIAHFLTRHEPKERQQIAARLAEEMALHYKKTTDPILECTHPDTGVSWDWLLMIAQRGDLKNRKHPGAKVTGENLPRVRADYAEALARWREEQEGRA